MTVRERSQGRVVGRILESLKNIVAGSQNEISRRRPWHNGAVGEPSNSVARANATSFGNVNVPTTVAVHVRTNVPAFFTVVGPRRTVIRFLVSQNANARRGNGIAIEIVEPLDLVVRRNPRIQPRTTKKIQSHFSLRKKFVPNRNREVPLDRSQTSNEVIFERSDGTFGVVGTMNTGWDSLPLDGLRIQKVGEDLGYFIIQSL